MRKSNADSGWERAEDAVAGLVVGCGNLVGEAQARVDAMGAVELELAEAQAQDRSQHSQSSSSSPLRFSIDRPQHRARTKSSTPG